MGSVVDRMVTGTKAYTRPLSAAVLTAFCTDVIALVPSNAPTSGRNSPALFSAVVASDGRSKAPSRLMPANSCTIGMPDVDA